MSTTSPSRVLRDITSAHNRNQSQSSLKQPLQERGASAKNVPPPRSAGNKTAFPKLAMQVYSPEEAIANAENIAPEHTSPDPLLLPKLLSIHSKPVDSVIASPATTFASPETITSSPESSFTEHASYSPEPINLRQSIDLVIPSYEFDPDNPPSSVESLPLTEDDVTEEVAREVKIQSSRASTARLSDYSIFPSPRSSQPPPPRISLVRSQSTASSNNWQTFSGASPDSSRTPDIHRHRRASSSPTSSHFAEEEGLGIQGIQYPARQPSSTASVETTPQKSTAGPARRLQRKRAVSNFGSHSQNAHSRTSSVDTGLQPSGNWAPISTLDVIHDRPGPSVSPVPEEQATPTEDDASDHWKRERADVIAELQHPAPSFYAYDSATSLSNADRTGPVGSFYHFLNDSYTAWARIYYGGEGVLGAGHSSQNSLSIRERSRERNRSGNRSRSRTPSRFSHFSRFSRSSRSTTTTDSRQIDVPAVPRIPRHMMRGSMHSSAPSVNGHSLHKSKASNFTQFTQFTQSTRPAYFSGMAEPQQYPLHITNTSRPPTSSSYSSWNRSAVDNRTESGWNDEMPGAQNHNGRHEGVDSALGSPNSAGFPDMVYVPRIRPRVQETASIGSGDSVVLVDSTPEVSVGSLVRAESTFPSAAPHTIQVPSPHLRPDRHSRGRMSDFRAPSFATDNKSWLDRVNRQIVLFIIGFVMPLAWLLAAVLPIPRRPAMRMMSEVSGRAGPAAGVESSWDLFDEQDVARWQKARRWRLTNRIMSVVGLLIVAVIGACAGVAAK